MCLCEMLWDSQHKRIMISHQFSSLLDFWFHSMFVKYPLFQLNKKKRIHKINENKKGVSSNTDFVDRPEQNINTTFFLFYFLMMIFGNGAQNPSFVMLYKFAVALQSSFFPVCCYYVYSR